MSQSKKDRILQFLREKGVVRAKGIRSQGISAVHQTTGTRRKNVRTGRGIYALADLDLTEYQSLVEASARVPHGVVCLLSALRYL